MPGLHRERRRDSVQDRCRQACQSVYTDGFFFHIVLWFLHFLCRYWGKKSFS